VGDFAVVVRTPRVDGASETVVDISLPGDAAAMERVLAGFKGRQRGINAVTEDFKASLRPIHWALNLPDSWQEFWQAPAAIAAAPQRMPELLERREDARRRFASDLKRYEGKLPDGLWRRLCAYAAGGEQR